MMQEDDDDEDDDAEVTRRYLKVEEEGKRTSEMFHKGVGMCLRELDKLDKLKREVRVEPTSLPPLLPPPPWMDASAMLNRVLRCISWTS